MLPPAVGAPRHSAVPGRSIGTKVEVCHKGRLVAAHDRVWARGQTITDPVHLAAAKVLREQYERPQSAVDPDEGPVRNLADYDGAFGLIDGDLADVGADEEVA